MSQQYTLMGGSTNPDNLLGAYQAIIQLSDGTTAFIYEDATNTWVLAHSPDGATVNTVASLPGFQTNSSQIQITLVRDSTDNIYVIGRDSAAATHTAIQAFVKGSGYVWNPTTRQSLATFGAGGAIVAYAATWCDTGTGTSNKGHILICWSDTNARPGYMVVSAGDALAGQTITLADAGGTNPFFIGGGFNTSSNAFDVEPDGFGALSGLCVAISIATVYVGSWAIDTTGKLTTSTDIGNIGTGQASAFTYWHARCIRYAPDAFAIVYPFNTSSLGVLQASKTAITVTNVTQPSGDGNWNYNDGLHTWDAYLNPVDNSKIVVLSHVQTAYDAGSGADNVQSWSVTCTANSTAWDAASTTVDSYTPDYGATSFRCVKTPANSAAYQICVRTGTNPTLYAIYGDAVTYNEAPYAPVLGSPANAGSIDATGNGTFTWTFSDPNPNDSQSAYAFRRKVSGAGSYEYWNAVTGAWQTTEVYNASTVGSLTFASGKWVVGSVYQWSVATKDSAGAVGPYAADRTVTAGQAPTTTVMAPSATVTDTNRPVVTWSYSDPDGQSQATWQVRVFTSAQYSATGFDPGASSATVDSGEQASVSQRSWQLSTALISGATYRAYVRTKDSSGLYSPWVYSGFTLSLSPPAQPLLAASYDSTDARTVLVVQGADNMLSAAAATSSGDWTAWDTGVTVTCGDTGQVDSTNGATASVHVVAGSGVPNAFGGAFAFVPGFAFLQAYGVLARLYVVTKPGVGSLVAYDTSSKTRLATVPVANVAVGSWFTLSGTAPAAAGSINDLAIGFEGQAIGSPFEFYIGHVMLAPGGVPAAWSRGGFVPGSTANVEYSDDGGVTWQPVRNGSGLALPGDTQKLTVYDYEATPYVPRLYRVTTIGNA